MKFFIDTANVEDIKKANDMGVICGVTTNPSLIAKEGKVFEEVIAEIASIVDGPISGEVKATTTDAEGMIAEGREIAKIHPNMVVKIPMTVEGLKAVKVLTAEGIKTNVTLVFSACSKSRRYICITIPWTSGRYLYKRSRLNLRDRTDLRSCRNRYRDHRSKRT